MRQTFEQIFAIRDYLLADGATGTNLFHAGLETGYSPELWHVEYPDRVTTSHASFIAAGADIILTNYFGGTSFRLKPHQYGTPEVMADYGVLAHDLGVKIIGGC